MDEWLTEFLASQSHVRTVPELACALTARLNEVVSAPTIRTERSGFHLAALNDRDEPEFWYVRNVMDDGATVTGQYEARDEIAHHCPEGIAPGQVIRVRNGDLHGHEVAWDALDEIGRGLLTHPAFRLGDGPVDRARWVRFKMQTIANAYEQFNPTTTIGRPIDAFGSRHPVSIRPHKVSLVNGTGLRDAFARLMTPLAHQEQIGTDGLASLENDVDLDSRQWNERIYRKYVGRRAPKSPSA